MATTEYKTFNIGENQDIGQTLQLLSMNLIAHKRAFGLIDAAYNGDTRGRFNNGTMFGNAVHHLNHFTINWLKMIVEAYASRLTIQGFNLGDGGDTEGNELAWNIWKANKLDKYANIAHREVMKFGQVYLMVDPTSTVRGFPRITIETPYQVVGWQDPQDRSQNVAAMKYWQGADGYVYCNLFTTEKVLKFRSPQSYYRWSEAGHVVYLPVPQSIDWQQYEEINHGLGVCPVFTIENQPTATRGGVSDLEELLPPQRAVDNLFRNMLLASEYGAFPQKYALNVEIPRDSQGNPMTQEMIEASMSRMWMYPPPAGKDTPEAKVGSFPATELTNFTVGIEATIHNMAMISSVPAYRLMGKLANLSASAILAAEAGFIDACKTKQVDYSTGWESAIGLAVKIARKSSEDEWVETLWKDPSAVSGANLAASLVALQTIGVPQPVLFRMLGAGPQEVEEWVKYNEEHAPEEPEEEDAPSDQGAVLANALTQLTADSSPNGNSNPDERDGEAA
jgi:hypothetical protein